MPGQPLHPLTGALWVPVWAVRPGSYDAVKDLAAEMPLFLLLYSRNADYFRPCYASREDLGATIGIGRAKVSRQLAKLRKASLVFEVDRGLERKSRRHRPPARWALDPFTAELWREKVEGALAKVAEEDGHDGRWLMRALTSLDAFDRRSRQLAAKIGVDMPIMPKRKKHRNGKKSKKKGAATQNEPRAQNGPRGDVYTTGKGVGAEPFEQGTRECGKERKNGRPLDQNERPPQTAALDAPADPSQDETPTREAA